MLIAQNKILRDHKGMSDAELPIPLDREKIAAFCRARGIRKLSLFGSVLRGDLIRRAATWTCWQSSRRMR